MTALEWIVWRTFKPVPKRFWPKDPSRPAGDPSENKNFARRANAVLEVIREHGPSHYTTIAHELGVSEQTAKRMTANGVRLGMLRTWQDARGRAMVGAA